MACNWLYQFKNKRYWMNQNVLIQNSCFLRNFIKNSKKCSIFQISQMPRGTLDLVYYSQTPLRAYRPWTDFLPVKCGYPQNGIYHTAQNMTDTTRVICVTAAFAAIDHLLNEMISYVFVLPCGSTLFASLRGREQTSIEVSVSKAYFIPETPSYFA